MRPHRLTFPLFLMATSLPIVSACGGGKTPAQSASASHSHQTMGDSSVAPPVENIQAPITQLERTAVVATIDAGLGQFLQQFQTEPSIDEEGRFVGFQIVRINDREAFRGLGIGPGDIVTAINSLSIESPTDAYSVFVSLRTAPSLEIDYLRGGHAMKLSLPIVGSAPAEEKPAPEKTSPAAESINPNSTP